MLNLSSKKEIENLKFEKTRLEIKISKLEKEIESLRKANKIQEDLLKDWEKSYKESLFEINKLKKELKEYNPKLKPRSKKISKADIKKIKNLYQLNEYTYREISQITKWSLCTVSKVINGFYD
ncbi:DNA-binding protein [Clostridium perfringens]|nr:DNA-binding protein [Clostridium perfringens]